jgi:hypothetical protein
VRPRVCHPSSVARVCEVKSSAPAVTYVLVPGFMVDDAGQSSGSMRHGNFGMSDVRVAMERGWRCARGLVGRVIMDGFG